MKTIKLISIITCFIFPSLIFAKTPEQVPQKNITTSVTAPLPTQIIITDSTILNWAKITAPKIRTYDFVQRREQMNKIKKYFSLKPWLTYFDRSPGWDEYYHSLEHEMNTAHEKRWFVDAKLNGNPVLVNKFIKDKTMFWQVKIPLLVSYISVDGKLQKPINMMMIVSPCINPPSRQNTTNTSASKTTNPSELCIERFYEIKS